MKTIKRALLIFVVYPVGGFMLLSVVFAAVFYSVAMLSDTARHLDRLTATLVYMAIPVVLTLIMFARWWATGRDPKPQTIIAEYSRPEDLSPMEASFLYDHTKIPSIIPSGILALAQKELIDIVVQERSGATAGDILMSKKHSAPAELPESEKLLFALLFVESESNVSLKRFLEIKEEIQSIYERVDSELCEKGYFHKSVFSTMGWYSLWATLFVFMGLQVLETDTMFFVVYFVCAVICLCFGRIMPRTTMKGARKRGELLGLRDYLVTVEKEKFEFAFSPTERPGKFDPLFPYAVALGVNNSWTTLIRSFSELLKNI